MSYLNDPSSNSEMRLQAVRGYYELEMYDDAWDELKEIEKKYPVTPLILQMKIFLVAMCVSSHYYVYGRLFF